MAPAHRKLLVRASEDVDLGTIELHVLLVAPVRVFVRGPAAARRTSIEANSCASPAGGINDRPSTRSNATVVNEAREFTFPPGRWELSASAWVSAEFWRSPGEIVDIGSGLPEITLELAPAVILEMRASRSEREVRVSRAGGCPSAPMTVAPGRPLKFFVAPGRYELHVRTPDGEQRLVPLAVGSSGATVDVP
jgi:hypothetical protein